MIAVSEQRKFVFTGIMIKGQRALFYEKCLYCSGDGITQKEVKKAVKENRLPYACPCAVLVMLPIEWIILPYRLGVGVIKLRRLYA